MGSPRVALLEVLLFGAGWGVGGLLFGLSVQHVGLSLATRIVLGMTSAVGSVVPLALYHREQIWRHTGVVVLASVVITAGGLVLCTMAGKQRV
jgi:L-rhamnose-H+ transport protein